MSLNIHRKADVYIDGTDLETLADLAEVARAWLRKALLEQHGERNFGDLDDEDFVGQWTAKQAREMHSLACVILEST